MSISKHWLINLIDYTIIISLVFILKRQQCSCINKSNSVLNIKHRFNRPSHQSMIHYCLSGSLDPVGSLTCKVYHWFINI